MYITANALKRVQELIKSINDSSILGLRIAVVSAGCGGSKFTFAFTNQIKETDTVIHEKDVLIVIDSSCIEYISGAILDFSPRENSVNTTFRIINSDLTECGCGKSFTNKF